MIGEEFEWIKVIERVKTPLGKNKHRGPYYRCLCSRCGNEDYVATSGDLRSGRIRSCGCYRNSQEFADTMVVHGHRRQNKGTTSRTWNAWIEMKRRCDDPNRQNARWYYDRGVKYDPRWARFENFLVDMGECPEGLELDRFPNNAGNYEPGNCRWTTHQENCQNRKRRA
jgi:hypothetical protein